jgi:Ca2+-binding EF-hand superfamily protein
MISPEEYTNIKEVLGYQYAPKIKAHFDKIGIKNTLGESYSTNSIRQIVNAEQPNEDLEFQILLLVMEKKALKNKRNELFK